MNWFMMLSGLVGWGLAVAGCWAFWREKQDTYCATRCRVCDTIECGTMYCRACWQELMAVCDKLNDEPAEAAGGG